MVTQTAPIKERSLSSAADSKNEAMAALLHGSAVTFRGKGVLILGPSMSGKSDLALRLIDAGAVLIADDQVWIRHEGDHLCAGPHDRLSGLINLRGIGIMRMPFEEGRLDLTVDLGQSDTALDPLPEPATASWFGVDLPKISLDPAASSAVARIRLVLDAERVF